MQDGQDRAMGDRAIIPCFLPEPARLRIKREVFGRAGIGVVRVPPEFRVDQAVPQFAGGHGGDGLLLQFVMVGRRGDDFRVSGRRKGCDEKTGGNTDHDNSLAGNGSPAIMPR